MGMLKDKIAVVFAASGAISGAVAKAFAANGAKLYLVARNLGKMEALITEFQSSGLPFELFEAGGMDEVAIEEVFKAVTAKEKRLDIVFNGIGARPSESDYGTSTLTIPFEQFIKPVNLHLGSQFLTSRIAAKHMIQTDSQGTILTLSASLSRLKVPFMSGVTASCCAVEGLTRVMAAEFGRAGIKVICINPTGMGETRTIQETSMECAKTMGLSMEEYGKMMSGTGSFLGKHLSLNDMAKVAAFLVSDAGAAFNSHVVDVDFGTPSVI